MKRKSRLERTSSVEYRVLSGYFLKNEELIRWVHRQTNRAVEAALRGDRLMDSIDVINIINNTNSDEAIKLAKKALKKYKILY